MNHLTEYLLEKYPLEVVGHWELQEGDPWPPANQSSNISCPLSDGRAETSGQLSQESGVLQSQQRSTAGKKKRTVRFEQRKGEVSGVLPGPQGQRSVQETEETGITQALLQEERDAVATKPKRVRRKKETRSDEKGQEHAGVSQESQEGSVQSKS